MKLARIFWLTILVHAAFASMRVTVSLFGAKPDEAKLAMWRDQGVERAVFTLPSAGRDTVLPLVDRYASLVTKVG